MKTDDAIGHLQIINIWASFALEHTEFCFTDAMLKSIDVWTQEIVK